MRFVIYDDESLEAITVVSLPLTDRDIAKGGRRWRVALPPELPLRVSGEPIEPTADLDLRVVEMEFEPIVRNSLRHGEQRSWLCFTRATELAMLMNPAWLPGQRRAVDYLQDQNDALTRLLMRASFSR